MGFGRDGGQLAPATRLFDAIGRERRLSRHTVSIRVSRRLCVREFVRPINSVNSRAVLMRRRGSLLVEVAVAASLVVIALIGVAQLVIVSGRQVRVLDQRRYAAQIAANALERVLARSWNEVTAERLSELSLSADDLHRLPEGQLKWELELSSEQPPTKRINAEISWRNMAG